MNGSCLVTEYHSYGTLLVRVTALILLTRYQMVLDFSSSPFKNPGFISYSGDKNSTRPLVITS